MKPMPGAYPLVLGILLHLTPHTARADTIGCSTPDLGLATVGAKGQADETLRDLIKRRASATEIQSHPELLVEASTPYGPDKT